MNDYKDKNIWIVGASSGIGYALAHELSKHGARLLLSARSADKLANLHDELEGNHEIFPLDVSNLDEVHNATAYAQEKFKTIDSVIHLAAIYDPGRIEDMDIKKTRLLVDVNIMGTFNLVNAVLPIIQKQRQGQIALCGSVAGFKGLPKGQPYSASKAAIINFAESFKAENPDLDIKLINPGFVRTALTDKNDFDMPMIIEPDEAARAIAKGLLKKNFEIHFPKKFTIWLKLLSILPYGLYFKMAKKLI